MNFTYVPCTVELHLSGLIGTANHSDMQKIRIIGFFFESRQFEVTIYSMNVTLNLSTTPDLKF